MMTPPGFVHVGPCIRCKVEFFLPEDLYRAARRDENITFYCPHGHPQVFRAGETEADEWRRKAQMAEQQVARWKTNYEIAERSASAYKGQVTNLRKRVGKGVCPCCNRTFQNLSQHMETQHPEFADEEPKAAEQDQP